MSKPNVYVLGGKIEIDLTSYDVDGDTFIPDYARLSIKEPDGVIITVSGGVGVLSPDLTATAVSGYLYYYYRPRLKGWVEYESWVKDGSGREGTDTAGFDIIDNVTN
jgi:hypothetical protein